MADLIRLNRTLAHIEANLSLWDQTQWVTEHSCGTSYCFAGWTLQLENIRICTSDCSRSAAPHVHQSDVPGSILERVHVRQDHNGLLSVAQVARVVLDLGLMQAWNLFCGDNTLNDLRTRVAAYSQRQTLNDTLQ